MVAVHEHIRSASQDGVTLQSQLRNALASLDEVRQQYEQRAREHWTAYYSSIRGIESEVRHIKASPDFEAFVASLFRSLGYRDVELTSINDFGADIICVAPDGVKIAVQVKHTINPRKNNAGVRAVQEVWSAVNYYKCTQGLVVTNGSFNAQTQMFLGMESARKL